MATGRKAFEAKSQASLVAAILNSDPPSLTTLQPLAPAGLDRLVQRCLAKEPERRWHCAHDLATELRWIIEGRSEAGAPLIKASRKGTLLAAAGAVLAGAAVTAIAVWLFFGGRAESGRRIVRATIGLPEGVGIYFERRSPVAISPDGLRVAIAGIRDTTRQLYLREFGESEARPIPGTEGGDGPFFSPDSQWIGFFAGSELMKVSVGGGAPQTILKARDVRGAAWGADGFIVLSPSLTVGLSRVAASGGGAEVLTVPNLEQREKSHRFPFMMPGGKAALITICRNDVSSHDDSRIGVLSLKTNQWKVLIEGGTGAKYSSTGHILYGRRGALLAAPFDPDKLEVTGPPTQVVDNVAVSPYFGVAAFDLSADGTLVYVPRGPAEPLKRLYAIDRQGRTQAILETPYLLYTVTVSPDGTRLAVQLSGANDSAWVYDIGRQALTKAVLRLGDVLTPFWSRDGSRLTYVTLQPPGLAWMAADGSGQENVLYTGENPLGYSEWSPDGQYLAFMESRPGNANDVYVLSLKDGRTCTPFVNTRYDERRPRFSPDGRWLAYMSNESGRGEVYVRPFPGPGGKWQVSTRGGFMHNWSRDGRELCYREGNRVMAVAVEGGAGRFKMSTPRPLFETSDTGPEDVLPDGRFLMIQSPQPDRPRELKLVLNWFLELRQRTLAK
jgi:serine/threonine-protein kinase